VGNTFDRAIVANFNGNSPASELDIQIFNSGSTIKLPDDYVSFLRKWDGGEGFFGLEYVILWRLSELNLMNREYEVDRYAPGLFLFGSNGGGEAYAFDARVPMKPIVAVPFVGMCLEEILPIANDFGEFLATLAKSQ